MRTFLKNILIASAILLTILTPLSLLGQGGYAVTLAQVDTGKVDTGSAQSGAKATADAAGIFSDKDLMQTVAEIVRFILGFLGIIFILLLMYGGFLRMTAQGKKDVIEKSTGIITSAIVGVAIILGSYIITAFVFAQLEKTIEDTGSVTAECQVNSDCDEKCGAGAGECSDEKCYCST